MTYSKIYIPSNDTYNKKTNGQSGVNSGVRNNQTIKIREKEINNFQNEQVYKEQPNEFCHRPEIVISEHVPKGGRTRTAFHVPSLGSVLAVVALCLSSFIIGTSVTDDAISSAIIGISSAASGQLPTRAEYTSDTNLQKDDSTTLYQKYMLQEGVSDSGTALSYLAANPYLSPLQAQKDTSDIPVAQEIAVESMSSGPIGVDGEILYPVVSKDLSSDNVHLLTNQTSYNPDTALLMSKTPQALQSLTVKSDEPLVLVVHTHGTEAYNECGKEGYYNSSLPLRSEDNSENVVGIGQKLVSVLNDFGIPAIHSEKLCDKESFVHAYSTSAEEVKAYLKKYPSIRFVIDLHRDSIESADKTKTNPLTNIAGKETAQLMFVVGTDEAGANHRNWQDNLSLALTLQSEISQDYPRLFRKINLRTASFNQQLSTGYLLLECGSCASSYEQAQSAVEMFATGLARVIKSHSL